MNLIRRYPLIAYFVLAYAITWTLQLAGIFLAAAQGMRLGNEANFLHFVALLKMQLPAEEALPFLLFSLGAGPLFAALIVTGITEGKAGMARLRQESVKWRVAPRWYLATLALPLVLSLVSLGIGLVSTGGSVAYTPQLPLESFIPFFLYMLVFTGITEEPGWRGFALPRLQSRYNAEQASWILGILWGVWHFPFIIYYNASLGLGPLFVSFLGLTLGIVGWTIVNTWLYNNTRSVFLLILLHGWGNAVHSYLVLSSNNYAAQTLYGILPWVIAILLLRVYGKENLSPLPRPKVS